MSESKINRAGTVYDIPDCELVRRAVTHAIRAKGKRRPAWVKVQEAFSLGSTYASQLCRRFGFDPDTGDTRGTATAPTPSQYIGKEDIWTSPATPSKQSKEGET